MGLPSGPLKRTAGLPLRVTRSAPAGIERVYCCRKTGAWTGSFLRTAGPASPGSEDERDGAGQRIDKVYMGTK